jgi:predicted RNA-binding protein with TRAM domain
MKEQTNNNIEDHSSDVVDSSLDIPIDTHTLYKVKIISIGKKGDGVAKIKHFTIIIPGTTMNQTPIIKITKIYSSYAFGEVIQ